MFKKLKKKSSNSKLGLEFEANGDSFFRFLVSFLIQFLIRFLVQFLIQRIFELVEFWSFQ